MNGLTNVIRHLIRSIIIAAGVAAFALSATQRVGAEEQSVDLAALGTYQAALCEAGGGTATVDTVRTGDGLLAVRVECTGGTLDGWTCTNVQGFTDCYFAGQKPEPTSPVTDNAVEPTGGVETESELSVLTANVAAHVVAPTGGVEVVEDGSQPMLATTEDGGAPTEGAEEQVAASQTSDPTAAAGVAISLCEVGGGTAVVDVVRKADGVDLVRVRCVGGSLDGWDCFFDKSGATICSDLPFDNPEESPAVEPTGGVETEPEPTIPTTDVADDVTAPTEGAEEPAGDEGAAPGEEGADGMAEGGTPDDAVDEEGGQDLPDNPAQDETTAPTEGDSVADPGAGTEGEGADETYILAGEYGGIIFVEMDDEQA